MGSERPGDTMPVAVVSVLAAAVFVAVTTEVLPVGLLPDIGAGLHTSQSRVGLLVSAYAVVVALGAIPLAALAVRWPRRQVLCGLLSLYAISNVVTAGAGEYWVAFAARVLGGLAHAGFFSVVFAVAVDVAPRGRQGRSMAAVSAGAALGLALGVPLGTALGTAFGWRWAFASCAGAMLLLAGLVLRVLPTAVAPIRHAAQVPVLSALRSAPLLAFAAVIVVLTLGHYTAFTYVRALLDHVGVGVGSVSLILFGFGAAGIIGLALAASVADRCPTRGLLVAMSLTAACLLLIGLVHGRASTIAAVVVWGVAFGALPSLIQAVALRAVPTVPDASSAAVNATFNVGIGGGAFVGARELLHTQPPTLALTGAALTGAALLLFGFVTMRTGRAAAGGARQESLDRPAGADCQSGM